MSDRFQNIYRIPSARAPWWDYARNASYFVTICTQDRKYFFGEIRDRIMQLSEIGKIVEREWLKTLDMRPDMNLELGPFVVMPNHFHAIIIIGENQYNKNLPTCDDMDNCGDAQYGDAMTQFGDDAQFVDGAQYRDAMHCVSTEPTEPTDPVVPPEQTNRAKTTDITPFILTKNHFGPQSKNLASIIRGFKIGVTKNARLIHADFAWQSRFHDHIIRNEQSWTTISEYIINNPINWRKDKFHQL